MRRLAGYNVIFDYDRTLVPEDSLLEVLKLALRHRADAEARVQDLQARSDRFVAGAARPEDAVMLLAAFLSIRRAAIDDYVAGARQTITPFRSLFRNLWDQGARLFIVSAAYQEWLMPIAASCGLPAAAVAGNRLLWIGERAVAPRDWSLLKSSNKAALVRRWRRDGVLSGPSIVVGDGAGDLEIHVSGLAEGFISAGYYAPGVAVTAPFARHARSIQELEPLILDLVDQIARA